MFEALKFWKKKPAPAAPVPVAEPIQEPTSLAEDLDSIFIEYEASLREIARASESPTFRDKHHTAADTTEALRRLVAERMALEAANG